MGRGAGLEELQVEPVQVLCSTGGKGKEQRRALTEVGTGGESVAVPCKRGSTAELRGR